MVVGNDVVDLAAARTRREHPAFAARVCSAAELRVIDASDDRTRTLWSFFAAKEAAYKALSKLRSVRFVPRAFAVDEDFTCVRYADEELRLRVFEAQHFVHALAFDGAQEPLSDIGECQEANASIEVRRLARALAARVLGEELSALAVLREPVPHSWDGYGPPRLLLRGRWAGFDVSLSHDGGCVACALERAARSEQCAVNS